LREGENSAVNPWTVWPFEGCNRYSLHAKVNHD